jgi:hypothetical protein
MGVYFTLEDDMFAPYSVRFFITLDSSANLSTKVKTCRPRRERQEMLAVVAANISCLLQFNRDRSQIRLLLLLVDIYGSVTLAMLEGALVTPEPSTLSTM